MATKSSAKRAASKIPAAAKKPASAAPAQHQAAPAPATPVVGMGASAGGLEAFTAVLRKLPEDTGMAFVLVQHLDPKHESLLVDLLGKATGMPVMPAREGEVVAPNRVYVIPPNTNLEISGGALRITERDPGPGVNMPVDCFFRSL